MLRDTWQSSDWWQVAAAASAAGAGEQAGLGGGGGRGTGEGAGQEDELGGGKTARSASWLVSWLVGNCSRCDHVKAAIGPPLVCHQFDAQ